MSEEQSKQHPHQVRNVNLLHKAEQEAAGFNDKLAVLLTKSVSTMWCAYAFFVLAMFGFPGFHATPQAYVQWISQTVVQLVMLAVIMKGQQIMGRHAELMAEESFQDIEQIMAALTVQDGRIVALDNKLGVILARIDEQQTKPIRAVRVKKQEAQS